MSVERQVVIRILRVAERINQRMGDVLQPHRLTLPQYGVLEALEGVGDEGLACGEIAVRLPTRDPDITRLLDRLEARGLIHRVRGRPDRRVVRSQLTAEGRRLVAAIGVEMRGLHRDDLARIGRRQLGTLHALLGAAE